MEQTSKLEIRYKGTLDLEHHHIPEWREEEQEMVPSFEHNGHRYFLDEFMDVHNKFYNPNPPKWQEGFDGYMSTSFFDGYLIKIVEDGEAVKLYHYCSQYYLNYQCLGGALPPIFYFSFYNTLGY